MADRNFQAEAYVLLDECRSLAEAGSDEMDAKAQQLVAVIQQETWGFLGRRAAKQELNALVANSRTNSEMAADWSRQTGDETLRRQAACFDRLARSLASVNLK